jgi:hypothetical protein
MNTLNDGGDILRDTTRPGKVAKTKMNTHMYINALVEGDIENEYLSTDCRLQNID